MAKRRASTGDGPNLSQHIRRYVTGHPKLGPKGIREGLAGEGIEVSTSLVNRILYGPGAKKRRGKRGRRPGAASAGDVISVNVLLRAKKLAKQLGGVSEAKAALDALARLQ